MCSGTCLCRCALITLRKSPAERRWIRYELDCRNCVPHSGHRHRRRQRNAEGQIWEDRHLRPNLPLQGYRTCGKIMRRLRRWLCTISPRYKFNQICKTIGIKPYPWQREFALDGYLDGCFSTPFPTGRATGKTTAIFLRLLMAYPNESFEAQQILSFDPDWRPYDSFRVRWYDSQYTRLSHACFSEGIPVVLLHRISTLRDLGRRP